MASSHCDLHCNAMYMTAAAGALRAVPSHKTQPQPQPHLADQLLNEQLSRCSLQGGRLGGWLQRSLPRQLLPFAPLLRIGLAGAHRWNGVRTPPLHMGAVAEWQRTHPVLNCRDAQGHPTTLNASISFLTLICTMSLMLNDASAS